MHLVQLARNLLTVAIKTIFSAIFLYITCIWENVIVIYVTLSDIDVEYLMVCHQYVPQSPLY